MVHSDEKCREWWSTVGYTINHRLIVGSIGLIRYNVHILKDPENGGISSPQYGYQYLRKIKDIYIFSTVWIPTFEYNERDLYLLHSMDTDI